FSALVKTDSPLSSLANLRHQQWPGIFFRTCRKALQRFLPSRSIQSSQQERSRRGSRRTQRAFGLNRRGNKSEIFSLGRTQFTLHSSFRNAHLKNRMIQASPVVLRSRKFHSTPWTRRKARQG